MQRHQREQHGLTEKESDRSEEDENAHEEEDMEGVDKSEESGCNEEESDDDNTHEEDMEGGDKSEDESEESDDDDDDEATYYNLWTYLRNSSTKDPDMDAKLLDLKERLNNGEMEDEELKKHRLFSDVTAMTLSSS